MDERSLVKLPTHVVGEVEVYVNGVLQEEGTDFERRPDGLVFARPLASEGKLGFWRWTGNFLGIAGSYRKNEVVDVVYLSGGKRLVESGLPFEAL